MQLFNLNETVIDTYTHNCVTVTAIIPSGVNSITDLYIVWDNELCQYYIADHTRLIVYDKHYWDDFPPDW